MQEHVNCKRQGFDDNTTIFGKILQGNAPATVIFEDNQVLVIKDIRPACKFHLLVIPKRHIKDSSSLCEKDTELLIHMIDVAKTIASNYIGIDNVKEELHNSNLVFGFHKWPLVMVNHLHMHVMYPMPASTLMHRMLYPQEYGRLFVSAEIILEDLKNRTAESRK